MLWQRYARYIVPIIVLGLALLTGIAVFRTAASIPHKYSYMSVMEASNRYLCYECHEESLVFSKENMPHGFLPKGIDHKLHLEAATKLAMNDNISSKYPACYTCHSLFKAENPGNVNFKTICSKCHAPGTSAFHEKIFEENGNCIKCHSDWKGLNTTVKLSFKKTVDMCRECHDGARVKKIKLSELHRIHGYIVDCKTCHSLSPPNHSTFINTIIAKPNTTCTKCHLGTGLHGIHYAGRKIECKTCHHGGVGAESYTSNTTLLLRCMKCHRPSNTTLHDKFRPKLLPAYNCLKCHSGWIDTAETPPRSLPDACNTCHPAGYTALRAYGLHLSHLLQGVVCSKCHGGLGDSIGHEEWIEEALNQDNCYTCHSMNHLMTTHYEFFSYTKNCFTSNCHSPVQWSWPKPPVIGENG